MNNPNKPLPEAIVLARQYMPKKALDVLASMYESYVAEKYEEAEIVREGKVAYLDLDRVSVRIVDQLLKAVYISCQDFGDKVERFSINECGRRAALKHLAKLRVNNGKKVKQV